MFFGEFPALGLKQEDYAIYRVDLETRQVEKLPGSEGLWPQQVSPDGRNIAAFTLDNTRLVLFSPSLRRFTELARGTSSTARSGRATEAISFSRISRRASSSLSIAFASGTTVWSAWPASLSSPALTRYHFLSPD